MKTRKLGTQGLEISTFGLGRTGMSVFYAGQDDAESLATIHRARDLGVHFRETPDVHGQVRDDGPIAVPLTPADIARLDRALPPGAAVGTRCPAVQMQAVHR